MKALVKQSAVTAILSSLFLSTAAIAGDEVCVVNMTATPVTAGSAGKNDSQIANSAFCISVSQWNDGPTVSVKKGIWVRGPGDTYVEVNIEDPAIGELDFQNGATGQAFGGADIGGGLHMSGASKGGDGVYRFIIE